MTDFHVRRKTYPEFTMRTELKIKQAMKAVLPPVVTLMLRKIRFLIAPPDFGLSYAPGGWRTAVPAARTFEGAAYLESKETEWREVWKPFVNSLAAGGIATEHPADPLNDRISAHNTWMTYAYVVSMAAAHGRPLKILDYGAGLGHCYGVARALLPGIPLEYHCKELSALVLLGRKFTPDATWHVDDSCLDAQYDLVVLGSVLQYLEDWPDLIHRAASAATHYLYITQTPVVEFGPAYVAIQRVNGQPILHNQINKAELLTAISKTGMTTVRQFLENPHTLIQGAPEQPVYFGCLLNRNARVE